MGGKLDEEAGMAAEEVRRRFAWARRQGRPAWLWPGISIDSWRAALVTIQDAAAAILAGEPGGRLDGDVEPLGLAGYTSGMGPLLGLWVDEGRLQASAPIKAELARHLGHNRRRAASMQAAHAGIATELAAHGIAAVVLKGAHTGITYFPEPGARPASDIDLLVSPADAQGAETVLTRRGLFLQKRSLWESSWSLPAASGAPRSLTYVHADDPWSIDLHTSLNISAGSGTPLAQLDLGAPMDSKSRWPDDARSAVLDQPLLLLHLATHAGAGWQNLTLLRQVELVLTIRRDEAEGRLHWGDFIALGKRTSALGYAYPALHLAERLAPGTVPENVLGVCAAQAPRAMQRRLEHLTPATAQRVERNSVAEHFMWAQGWNGRMRLFASDLLPAAGRWPDFWRIYEERAWRFIRGTVSQ